VARVQYLSGEVSTAPAGTDRWVAATLNRPLTGNTYIWTDRNSKTELNVGDGFIRMNSETSVTLTNIDRSTVQFQINQGTVSLTVQRLQSGEIYEIDTPNAVLTVMKPGVYRVDVHSNNQQTSVTVRKGSLAATGQGSAVNISANEQDVFRNGNSLQHTSENARVPDGFEDWASVRDQRLAPPRRGPYFAVGIGGFGPWGVVAFPRPVRGPRPWPPVWAPYPYPR
jgi:ferric-dicitrate binding protein FerR (iron transport regulator)